jgi:hypothetical protein
MATLLAATALVALWWVWRRDRAVWRENLRRMHAALAEILSDRR